MSSCATYRVDSFDSSILGKPVARLSLSNDSLNPSFDSEFEQFCLVNNVALIFVSLPFHVEKIRFFEQRNFYLVSAITEYVFDVRMFRPQLSLQKDILDLDQIVEITFDMSLEDHALALFSVGHYAADGNLDKSFGLAIYKQWIINTFSGYGDKVFYVLDTNKLIGFISLKKKAHGFLVDLLCVHPDFRGQGVAKSLLRRVITFCMDSQMALHIGTQSDNIIANRLYQKEGFVMKDIRLVYHKML
jgi:ribosomal protein S18 acetylase RimI-like enzyme